MVAKDLILFHTYRYIHKISFRRIRLMAQILHQWIGGFISLPAIIGGVRFSSSTKIRFGIPMYSIYPRNPTSPETMLWPSLTLMALECRLWNWAPKLLLKLAALPAHLLEQPRVRGPLRLLLALGIQLSRMWLILSPLPQKQGISGFPKLQSIIEWDVCSTLVEVGAKARRCLMNWWSNGIRVANPGNLWSKYSSLAATIRTAGSKHSPLPTWFPKFKCLELFVSTSNPSAMFTLFLSILLLNRSLWRKSSSWNWSSSKRRA